MAAGPAAGGAPWVMRNGAWSQATDESHRAYEDSLAERTLEGASTGETIGRVVGRGLYGVGATLGAVVSGTVGAAGVVVGGTLGAAAGLLPGRTFSEDLGFGAEVGAGVGSKLYNTLGVNTAAQRAFKGTEVEKVYNSVNPRAENFHRVAIGKEALSYTPGESSSLKSFFEGQREREFSGMRYALDVQAGRVIIEKKDNAGNLTYESYTVSDGSTSEGVTSEARLLKAVRQIITTLNDKDAGDVFEKHDLVVFHINAPEQQGGEGTVLMRGFKRENIDARGRWIEDQPMFSVDTSSSLEGAEIKVGDALRKDICDIQGFTKKKEGALDDNGDVNNNKSAEKKRAEQLADLKKLEEARKGLLGNPEQELEALEGAREGLRGNPSGDLSRLGSALRGLREAPLADEVDLRSAASPVLGAPVAAPVAMGDDDDDLGEVPYLQAFRKYENWLRDGNPALNNAAHQGQFIKEMREYFIYTSEGQTLGREFANNTLGYIEASLDTFATKVATVMDEIRKRKASAM